MIGSKTLEYVVGGRQVLASLSLFEAENLLIAVLFVYQFSGFSSEDVQIKPFWEYVELTSVEFPNEILLVSNPRFYRLKASSVEEAVREAVKFYSATRGN